ncbi:MAG: hypothetical protein A2X12_01835 [Bacteroidetes bacterium GWE2_29_8]|nr:MAG: hypothetical protein A2X12_01835 [Bacteroidetes bacterium GWE2_29_8]OFY23970.1 MAG: hypothetical protein A2X02_00975 [Bacteroidetes bacterium GWF2_29_10]
MKKQILQIKSKLEDSSIKNIAIISHVNPDGDAVGSSLALYDIFNKMHYSVNIVTPSDYPDFLNWMQATDKVINAKKNLALAKNCLEKADIIFCVDFNSIKRVDIMEEYLKTANAFKILIDHHIDPELFADIIISDTKYSSTAELIYNVIKELGYEKLIDKNIAEAIYVGIITDTGSFSYSNTKSETHVIAAELIKYGINNSLINDSIYQTYSADRLRLLGHTLCNRLKIFPNKACSYIYLSKEDLANYNYKDGDTEGIVNYGLSINGINMTAMFIEKENYIKISFRSKGNFSVNDLAKKYFNGGGHKNSAGGQLECSLGDATKLFEDITDNIINEITNV